MLCTRGREHHPCQATSWRNHTRSRLQLGTTMQAAASRSCSRQRSDVPPERQAMAMGRHLRTRIALDVVVTSPRDGVTVVGEVQHDEQDQRAAVDDHRHLGRVQPAPAFAALMSGSMSRPRAAPGTRRQRPSNWTGIRSPPALMQFASLSSFSMQPQGGTPGAISMRKQEPWVACFVRSPRGRVHPFGRSNRMDLVYIGLTVGFFVVSWAFIVACERLS